MRETNFIRQNQEKWSDFEQMLEGKEQDPERLNELFVQITDDLSYSRTFYPNRSVRVYLNGLAQQIFFSIYKTKSSRWGRFAKFWTLELPSIVYESRRDFNLSLLVFLLAMGIGVLSSAMDPEFARVILGDSYVEMTLQNIENDDPMAVYKERGAFGMSLGITANNIFVALLTFLMGGLFAIGTIGALLTNGIMVGAFQYFFIERGLFWESFLTIWMHGAFEISAIVIAGAAGLTMGRGLVLPGTLSRGKSFQRSSRRGLKIMVGIIPLFIVAGFLEGFVTRHTELPNTIRLIFILTCFAIVIGYFWIYPRWLARHGFLKNSKKEKLTPQKQFELQLDRIKPAGELFSDGFTFLREHFGRHFGLAALLSLFAVGLSCLITWKLPSELYYYPDAVLSGYLQNISYNLIAGDLLGLGVTALIFTLSLGLTNQYFLKIIEKDASENNSQKNRAGWLSALVTGIILATSFKMNGFLIWLAVVFLLPALLLTVFVSFAERLYFFAALGRAFGLLGKEFARWLGLVALLLLIATAIFFALDTQVFQYIVGIIALNFSGIETNELGLVFITFCTYLVFYLLFSLFTIAFGLLYYVLIEIKEARGLLARVAAVGVQTKIRGLERE